VPEPQELLRNLPLYCQHILKIRPKTGAIIPLDLNRAQLYLHKRAEDQRKRTGKVRLVVLKGRQQGISTYIAARFYHQTAGREGILTFIFAHDSEGSDSLYTMVKNYYDLSNEGFRPPLGKSNAKELLFPALQSGYKVGTAGTGKGLGRSKTFQQLHGSEVAFWPNADDHASGVLQCVADLPGTEIMLESTSNGMGDYFHRACMQALQGQSGFELVFVPWYWQDEYKADVADFQPEPRREGDEFTSEQEYMDLFARDGLTLSHLAWRRNKIRSDFQGDIVRFMREYPFTPEEAFESASEDAFIKPMLIRRARNTPPVLPTSAPLIMGVDPARLGGDRFKVCHTQGRNLSMLYTIPPGRVDETAQRLAEKINKYKPARVNIDCGGLGVGVYDILVGNGYGNIVRKVDMGASANDPDRYYNKRAELHGKAREWLEDLPVSISCDPKEADALQMEAAVCKAIWKQNSRLLITPKDDIKKELKFSPDTWDSFILTRDGNVANPDVLKGATPQRTIIGDTSWSPF
jgi:hypothetical protein